MFSPPAFTIPSNQGPCNHDDRSFSNVIDETVNNTAISHEASLAEWDYLYSESTALAHTPPADAYLAPNSFLLSQGLEYQNS